jgi:hypothetical protein
MFQQPPLPLTVGTINRILAKIAGNTANGMQCNSMYRKRDM